MNLGDVADPARLAVFRLWRFLIGFVPGGRIGVFGAGPHQINGIVVVNLDRQPRRLRRVKRELGRFRTSEGAPLTEMVRRFPAVDARDGRAVAATADVDPIYRIGDQLFVQPDSRVAACFATNEPVRMTRQEVAVARSHVEVWKSVASGRESHVLVLEDDVWFKPGAAGSIERGWGAAVERCDKEGGPNLLYLSFSDADGTAERNDVCDHLFRPARGLWFLSGYVLSREGANALLNAMPVVGPADLWMNFRFEELGALALLSPALAQRRDGSSDNAYSMLPYLARAGVVDVERQLKPPVLSSCGPVLAWSKATGTESIAMALSILGLRVRAFDGDEATLTNAELAEVLQTFDAVVDPPLVHEGLTDLAARPDAVFVVESGAKMVSAIELALSRTRAPCRATVVPIDTRERSWTGLCEALGVGVPVENFPAGAPRSSRLFRDDRQRRLQGFSGQTRLAPRPMDESPWLLPSATRWKPSASALPAVPRNRKTVAQAALTGATPAFPALVETFPGNLASFARENVAYSPTGAQLLLRVSEGERGGRPYRSGAFASKDTYSYGRFEAVIRAAPAPGLITGFFLHRSAPRQEIDIEFPGNDPTRMLVNVYFNPGDDGMTIDYGYRGSPCTIDLGFDASASFHRYAIEWREDRVLWIVDGVVVHERVGWDPTPIPHLSMRLHANLWAPRSADLAGRLDPRLLPSRATFREVRISA